LWLYLMDRNDSRRRNQFTRSSKPHIEVQLRSTTTRDYPLLKRKGRAERAAKTDPHPSASRRHINDVDHHRGHGDLDPNHARFPSGDLSRSTTGDTDSSNAPVQHTNPAAVPRFRGRARHVFRWLCPVLLPPFQPRVGTSLCHRQRVPAVLRQKTKARPPPFLPLLSFLIVESRCSPFISLVAHGCHRDLIESTITELPAPGISSQD
jgi:hypothetical protein